jgi:Glycosyltransferase family 87
VFVKCRDSALSGCPDAPSRETPGAAAPRGARDLAAGLAGHVVRLLRLGHMRWYAIRPEHGLGFDRRRMVIWYAAFAIYAGAVTICSGGGADGAWGVWATIGYALAAIVATRSRGYAAPLLTALVVALLAPTAWLTLRAPTTADVTVVAMSAHLLLRTGSPYLPAGRLANWQLYNPYLPAMALFGLPKALGLPGLIGDPRLWLTIASAVLLAAAFWMVAPRSDSRCRNCLGAAAWCAVFAVASPVLALPLAVGITDPPVIALMCFALACAARFRMTGSARLPLMAGLAIGFACAMKATAWPALAVLAALFAARDGLSVARRFVGASILTTAVLIAVCAPGLLAKPAGLLQNVVLYPLGMTQHKTPAASPMPGHLLASIGEVGHVAAIGLLLAAALVIAGSLVVRPPADVPAATRRLAIALAVMFILAPATRFGYFSYPVALLGWLAMTIQARSPAGHDRAGLQPAAEPVVPVQGVNGAQRVRQGSGPGEPLRRAMRYLLPERGTVARILRRRKARENPLTQ